jgi:hypothetical protein
MIQYRETILYYPLVETEISIGNNRGHKYQYSIPLLLSPCFILNQINVNALFFNSIKPLSDS